MSKSLYDILEVDSDATLGAIKSAFTRLKNQLEAVDVLDQEAQVNRLRYMAVSEAYETLSNPARRAVYDQKLINQQQAAYEAEEVVSFWSPKKIAISVFAVAMVAALAYNFQLSRARDAREAARLQLEKEQVELKQAELKLEQEQAEAERQKLTLAENEAAQARSRNIVQFRVEARQYVSEVAIREERERRQAEYDRQAQARAEMERQRQQQRYARPAPGPSINIIR